MLDFAWSGFDRVVAECDAFDAKLMADARRVGGDEYADLIALSHRQVLAGGKIVASPKGTPWFIHKENSSNVCIATVDVIFPTSPYFFLFNPVLVKAMLEPILDYAESDGWYFDLRRMIWVSIRWPTGTITASTQGVINGSNEGQSPRLFFKTSPLASMSKGFLHIGTSCQSVIVCVQTAGNSDLQAANCHASAEA